MTVGPITTHEARHVLHVEVLSVARRSRGVVVGLLAVVSAVTIAASNARLAKHLFLAPYPHFVVCMNGVVIY